MWRFSGLKVEFQAISNFRNLEPAKFEPVRNLAIRSIAFVDPFAGLAACQFDCFALCMFASAHLFEGFIATRHKSLILVRNSRPNKNVCL